MIIKDIGLVEICNELVADGLAKRSDLQTPNCYIGLVRNNEIPVVKGSIVQQGRCLVFISEKVKVPSVTFQWIGKQATEIRRHVLG